MADQQMPPGTFYLSEGSRKDVVRQPRPSTDPNDPLNWSRLRKTVNYGVILLYVLFTFVLLDIPFIGYAQIVTDLGMTFQLANIAGALNFAGLAVGSIVLVPLTYRYGRRPIYLASTAVQFASCLWMARVRTRAEYIGCATLMGLGGAISETLVQMTIADLFFVHQYATMNGLFLFMQGVGAFLGPVAAGYIVISQGWRWMWWWTGIFLGVTLLIVFLFFEESAYIRPRHASDADSQVPGSDGTQPKEACVEHEVADGVTRKSSKQDLEFNQATPSVTQASTVEIKPLRKRLALITKHDVSITHRFVSPFIILVTFPAVAYAAITYGTLITILSMLLTFASTQLVYPPYNFTAAGVGLINIAPFIGQLLGALVVAPLSDRWIIMKARKNGGIFEPEMRLSVALAGAPFVCAGTLIFGVGLAHNASWVILALGLGIFSFGFSVALDISLAYLTDCYQKIIGDSLVGVVFVRNGLAVVVLFVQSPWVDGMGLQNMFILAAVLGTIILLIPILLIIWGKRARVATAEKYERHARLY